MMSMPWGSSGGIQPYGGGQMHTEKAGKGQSRGPTRREDEEPWLAGHDSPLLTTSVSVVGLDRSTVRLIEIAKTEVAADVTKIV